MDHKWQTNFYCAGQCNVVENSHLELARNTSPSCSHRHVSLEAFQLPNATDICMVGLHSSTLDAASGCAF